MSCPLCCKLRARIFDAIQDDVNANHVPRGSRKGVLYGKGEGV